MNYAVSISHEPQIIYVMTSDRSMLGLHNKYVMNTRSYLDSQTLPKNTRNASTKNLRWRMEGGWTVFFENYLRLWSKQTDTFIAMM